MANEGREPELPAWRSTDGRTDEPGSTAGGPHPIRQPALVVAEIRLCGYCDGLIGDDGLCTPCGKDEGRCDCEPDPCPVCVTCGLRHAQILGCHADWIRSERARVLRWLAGELESGRRSVVTWDMSDPFDDRERFVIEVKRNV